jgi:hypothetical protein
MPPPASAVLKFRLSQLPLASRESVGMRVAVPRSTSVFTKRAPHPALSSRWGEGPFTERERRNARDFSEIEANDREREGDTLELLGKEVAQVALRDLNQRVGPFLPIRPSGGP